MNSAILDKVRPLALQAGERLMELLSTPLIKERKADRSWVTNADKDADAIIRAGLRAAFPDHSILTEESGLEGPAKADFIWVVDPLDGTKAYLNGVTGFSVMIGVLHKGIPWAGIVFDPMEDRFYEAVRGFGAFQTHQGQRAAVRVSNRKDYAQMPVTTSTGFPEKVGTALAKTFTGPWIVPVNSVGVKVGLVVRQVADIYVNHHGVSLWDTCAPQVILEEAGGVISYLNGKPLAYDMATSHRHPGPTLATNGTRHQDCLRTLSEVLS